MLKLKYLFENYALAKEALAHWEHDAASLDRMLSQFRISSNAIYPFLHGEKRCFLRLAPTEEKQENNIIGELEFIRFLRGHGYAALTPIPARSGEYYLRLTTSFGEYYASAFEEVPGVPIESTDYSPEIMYAYGRALAQLHNLSERFTPNTRKWAHREALDWTAGTLEAYGAPDFVFRELDALKSALEALPIRSDNYGLVHYDFEPDNVFWDPQAKLCSVIDFDDGMYHWYSLDLEQVFDCLAEELEADALQTAKECFLCGYRELRAFSEEAKLSLPLMHRFINLYGYARLRRSVAEQFEDEPDWLVQLRKKLNASIAGKESAMLP